MKKRKVYSSYYLSEELIRLNKSLPNCKEIISFVIEPEIINERIVDTIKGVSIEGNNLTGKKLVVQIRLKQKVLYLADKSEDIYTLENEYYENGYVILPFEIEGSDPQRLLNFDYLTTKVKLLEPNFKILNSREIYKNISIYLESVFTPSYELCFSSRSNLNDLFITKINNFEPLKITEKSNNIMPKWAPNGRSIAYLSDKEGKNRYMLYVSFIKNKKIKKLTTLDAFECITSFCWLGDSEKIVFAGFLANKKDLYMIDINTLELKQLTFGEGIVKNYQPKLSPLKDEIAFLTSINNIPNISILNLTNYSIKKITGSGFIKDFTWSIDGRKISYIYSKDKKCDMIYTLDLFNNQNKLVNVNPELIKLNNIKYLVDDKYISFIGSDLLKDDIYFYNLEEDKLFNITKNYNDVDISDFVFNTDFSRVYYAANDLKYYNIYSIDLSNYHKYAHTSLISSHIDLDYRPKII